MDGRPPSALLARITCPHCWHRFEPKDILWIATHPSLRGDPRLGADAHRRFLPSRFTPRCTALDEMGEECTQSACPHCHLTIPRACLGSKPWFVSIFGAPASGKSYYLAAMTRALRRQLPGAFRVSFTDTDADANQLLASYEQSLFYNAAPDELLPLGDLIEKTKEQGDLYSTAMFGTNVVQYPRPFLFTLRPGPGHPHGTDAASTSRVLCLYDNAGESFLAGRDSSVRPVTRHLAESSLLLFLFDPTQHPPFRSRLASVKAEVASDIRTGEGVNRQDLILTEAADRVRRFAGLRATDKHRKPLVVVVTKLDVWERLLPDALLDKTLIGNSRTGLAALHLDRILERSAAIRRLLLDLTPEVVSSAESFAASVTYIGVSSLGTPPVRHPATGRWAVRPVDVRPRGVEVPLLFGLNRQFPRLIPGGRRPATRAPLTE